MYTVGFPVDCKTGVIDVERLLVGFFSWSLDLLENPVKMAELNPVVKHGGFHKWYAWFILKNPTKMI